ncbi:hypothetical protein PENTCL1PPCAC_4477 [Pristionchus entomophagus]|uniref:Uncharacterized protein n=1 Tax=Pristionchus entomophagus TaxID=358040 RepID=A0AAV5SG21_9BILA|nr:hypothetical protein PENTCL1PPCAC_4477 [Pristionchus entomophagus]
MLNSKLVLIVLAVLRCSNCFLVGDCIGPKSALERHLDKSERSMLRSIVHEHFNGKNSQEVMRLVLTFVRSRLSTAEWTQIQPEIRAHEARQPECSVYAQLLPSALYRRLLQRVWDATERGADQAEVRRIVDAFVADLTARGQLPTVPPTPQDASQDDDDNRPAPRARRTFPALPQYPEQLQYPDDERPWYAGAPAPIMPPERTVDWSVIDRRPGRSFVPLPAARPVRWFHSGSQQHVPQRRPNANVFPTLIPPLGTAIERTQDDGEEEEEDTEPHPVFERFSFGHSDSARRAEFLPPPPLPIPVAKMPRIRLSDGRYMRPPLTLKAARAMSTRTPRTAGTTTHRLPLQTRAPLVSPDPPAHSVPLPSTSRHSRKRRPLAPVSQQLTFPRVLPHFGQVGASVAPLPAPTRRHHPPLIDLN